MQLRSIFLSIILVVSSSYAQSEEQYFVQQVLTRAVLEIGSGETKIMVADVDVITNKIVTIWHQGFKKISLKKDVASSSDNCLSSGIEQEVISTILSMKEKVKQFRPVEWVAVGTSVFRTAKNGQEFLERVKQATNIEVRLLPQIEEAEIGFATAVEASGKSVKNTISWDSGSGSFQIASMENGKLEMYGAEFAFVPTLEALFAIRNQPFNVNSPNPTSLEEALKLIKAVRANLPSAPLWLANNNKNVFGIGGDAGDLFHIGSVAAGRTTYTKEELFEAILQACDKSDEQLRGKFVKPEKVIIALVLMYTIMDHCGIKEVTYCPTIGSCKGMLLTPRLWKIRNYLDVLEPSSVW